MKDYKALAGALKNLDGRNYTSYKGIAGVYLFLDFTLFIDHVQGDPFASPSRLRVQIPQSIAGFPADTFLTKSREIALRDYLARMFREAALKEASKKGSGKSGEITVAAAGQEILERTAVIVNEQMVEARFTTGLPANGRRILGFQAVELLCDEIPRMVSKSLKFQSLDSAQLYRHIKTAEDADSIRNKLILGHHVAFIANGSILPRKSGVDQRRLERAIPFQSPKTLEATFDTPNSGSVTGMLVPAGTTLIVDGGFHGKSTLLNAIALGVYNHIPGDGREFAVSSPMAVKIKAEEGRSIQKVDISPFINLLPLGISTKDFQTANASGSVSQAANIVEALEAGARILLLDEDTSATNFMIRDKRMQQLIAKDKEPITPLIDRINALKDEHGVSTLIVMGGSGDYFDVADLVIGMKDYKPEDLTNEARAIAGEFPTGRAAESKGGFGAIKRRKLLLKSLDPSRGRKPVAVKTRKTDSIEFGTQEINLNAVDQLVDNGQLKAIGEALVFIKNDRQSPDLTLPEILNRVLFFIEENGIQGISQTPKGDLVRFRIFELAAAVNRLRGLVVLD